MMSATIRTDGFLVVQRQLERYRLDRSRLGVDFCSDDKTPVPVVPKPLMVRPKPTYPAGSGRSLHDINACFADVAPPRGGVVARGVARSNAVSAAKSAASSVEFAVENQGY